MLPAPKGTPLVSVVMATYNQCAYIRQALDSLKAQTLAAWDFEVIVVNDGSTDNTSKILDDYRGWIRVVEKENRAWSQAVMKVLRCHGADISGKEVSSNKALEELGWQPRTSFEGGLRHYIEWYKQEQDQCNQRWTQVADSLKM